MFRPSFLALVVAIGFLACTWHNSAAARPDADPAEGVAAASVKAEPASGPGVATVAPLVPEPVRRLMQDRKYAEAVEAIDEALKADDAPKAYLLYLKARALHLDEKYDEAVAAFEPEVVHHLAALAGVRRSLEDPARYLQVNVAGTLNLLEAIRSAPAPARLVFASSSSVY
ncbi:MAG: GDP-mannose 4,6-dehydratase, partial [Thermoguttaceae bacterium]